MTCTCPKCHQKIELDLPEVTEAGTSAACPACSARFNLFKESFGARALRKSSEISCAACGSELGSETHCPSCGAQFPDYLVVSLGRRRARKESKKIKLKTSPFPKKETAATVLPSLGMSMKPEDARLLPVQASGSRLPKPLVIIATVLLVIVLAAGGAMAYLKNKAEKSYAKNFVLATYCLQTGIDRAAKANTRISAEWKAKMEAGQPYTPRASIEDDRDFGIIGNKFDQAMQKLSNPPEKFASSNEKLTKLQSVYNKARSLAYTPGASLPGFMDSANRLDNDYKQAAKEFKAGMPDEIMDELVSAGLKFKSLRPLLKS